MAIGKNVLVEDKLIRKTTNNASSTSNTSKVSNTRHTSIARKSDNATSNTIKMTFYIKSDLFKRLRNYAYWDRLNLTEAFNGVLVDGLKGKNTQDKK